MSRSSWIKFQAIPYRIRLSSNQIESSNPLVVGSSCSNRLDAIVPNFRAKDVNKETLSKFKNEQVIVLANSTAPSNDVRQIGQLVQAY